MDTIIQTFEDEDLVIPKNLIRQLGVKPGDTVEIRRAPESEVPQLEASEKARRLEIIRSLRGAWSAEDAEAFERAREEMWRK